MKRRTSITLLSALTLAATAGLLVAGPLNPPGGPVTGTYKTLTEVEPRIAINATNTPGDSFSLFKITQPGSYYLTGNITGVANRHGIEIAASGVTLDLNGFELAGVSGSLSGVRITLSNIERTTIRNGSVRGWGGDGISCGTSNYAGTIDGVTASRNAMEGIEVGNAWTVTRCVANDNGGRGIVAYSTSVLTNCQAVRNGGSGFYVTAGAIVTQCSADDNALHGFEGEFTNVTFDRCSATRNSIGFKLDTGSVITDCLATNNTTDGIRVVSKCLVRGNHCIDNGNSGDGAGIYASSTDNRIEANTCIGADRGIDVDGGGNIIIRNACSGNTINWQIAPNNVYGPILDRTAPASAAVSGNAATSAIGSFDAHANLTY